jgi:hypothetical protein
VEVVVVEVDEEGISTIGVETRKMDGSGGLWIINHETNHVRELPHLSLTAWAVGCVRI